MGYAGSLKWAAQQLAPKAAALRHEQGGEARLKHLSISEISFFW